MGILPFGRTCKGKLRRAAPRVSSPSTVLKLWFALSTPSRSKPLAPHRDSPASALSHRNSDRLLRSRHGFFEPPLSPAYKRATTRLRDSAPVLIFAVLIAGWSNSGSLLSRQQI